MLCPFDHLEHLLAQALDFSYGHHLQSQGITFSDFSLVYNKDSRTKGHFSSPLCFALGKILRENPLQVAETLCQYFRDHPSEALERLENAKGYLNIWLPLTYWATFLPAILNTMEQDVMGFSPPDVLAKASSPTLPVQSYGFGYNQEGHAKRVNVEYVSANPTGPLHGAHGRGAIFGDILANLFVSQGYEVCREYFINDAGQQMKTLGATLGLHREAFLKGKEALIPQGLYPGSYVRDIVEDYYKKYPLSLSSSEQRDPEETLEDFALEWLMSDIRQDLHLLGIHHDLFTSEKALHKRGDVEKVVDLLDKGGYVYKGSLETPDYEGKKVQRSSEKESPEETLLLFRSTAFGDVHDRALKNREGQWTYFAGDIAYHWHKYCRGYDKILDIWGADHGGHVASVKGALEALKDITGKKDPLDFEVELYQMVHFYKNGQAVKMSKRAGNILSLSQVLSDIPADVLRFMMIQKKSDTHLILKYEDMLLQGKENPVFYIHYSHARALSVLRHSLSLFSPEELHPRVLKNVSLESLKYHEGVWSIVGFMTSWPRVLKNATLRKEPHLVAHYAYDLAQLFHQVWNEGNQEDSLRFFQPSNKNQTLCFMAFLQSFVHVLRTSMGILGIGLKEEMR